MSDETESDVIDDPIEFFAALGGLRDVGINGITVDVEDQALRIFVDDLYWCLEGSPDYPGERPCALVFGGVTGVRFDFDMVDGLRIAGVAVNENISTTQPFALGIDLNIGGTSASGSSASGTSARGKALVAMFATLEIEDFDD
ncbi:hypothetical protein [Dongia sp.]|uniref:hypothetical protein n=1 Tax=Dongia sp. TaxID=1977262 RepID=UPI0035AFB83D